jgi:hypothetical protein
MPSLEVIAIPHDSIIDNCLNLKAVFIPYTVKTSLISSLLIGYYDAVIYTDYLSCPKNQGLTYGNGIAVPIIWNSADIFFRTYFNVIEE